MGVGDPSVDKQVSFIPKLTTFPLFPNFLEATHLFSL